MGGAVDGDAGAAVGTIVTTTVTTTAVGGTVFGAAFDVGGAVERVGALVVLDDVVAVSVVSTVFASGADVEQPATSNAQAAISTVIVVVAAREFLIKRNVLQRRVPSRQHVGSQQGSVVVSTSTSTSTPTIRAGVRFTDSPARGLGQSVESASTK